MKVSEIFYSIEGEGIRSGLPSVFIRLHGCNLRCSYCDSMYAVDGSDFDDKTVDDIVNYVTTEFSCKRVTLTGGEPLIHKDAKELVRKLMLKEISVNIETNGAVDLTDMSHLRSIMPVGELIFTMDWKSVSSNMSDRMIPSNVNLLDESDVIKFVVGNKRDLDQMQHVIKYLKPKCNIFVSPTFGDIDPRDIVDYVLANNLTDCRVQLQMHKLIWDPNKRGV